MSIAWIIGVASPLVFGVVAGYYRYKWLAVKGALDLIKSVRDEWTATNAVLQERVAKAEAALVVRHTQESARDQETASSAGHDAAAAADLLNGLHQGSAGGHASDPVQPGPVPDVPKPLGFRVP